MRLRGPLVARTVDRTLLLAIIWGPSTTDFFRGPPIGPIGLRAQGRSCLARNVDITLQFAHAEGFDKQKGTI